MADESTHERDFKSAGEAYLEIKTKIAKAESYVEASEHMFPSPGPAAAEMLSILRRRSALHSLKLEADANEIAHKLCRAHYISLAVDIAQVNKNRGLTAYDEDITSDAIARDRADHIIKHLSSEAKSAMLEMLKSVLS